jgi:hypothetical protein
MTPRRLKRIRRLQIFLSVDRANIATRISPSCSTPPPMHCTTAFDAAEPLLQEAVAIARSVLAPHHVAEAFFGRIVDDHSHFTCEQCRCGWSVAAVSIVWEVIWRHGRALTGAADIEKQTPAHWPRLDASEHDATWVHTVTYARSRERPVFTGHCDCSLAIPHVPAPRVDNGENRRSALVRSNSEVTAGPALPRAKKAGDERRSSHYPSQSSHRTKCGSISQCSARSKVSLAETSWSFGGFGSIVPF